MTPEAHISRMKAMAAPAADLVDAIREQAQSIAAALSELNGRPYRVCIGRDARVVAVIPD